MTTDDRQSWGGTLAGVADRRVRVPRREDVAPDRHPRTLDWREGSLDPAH